MRGPMDGPGGQQGPGSGAPGESAAARALRSMAGPIGNGLVDKLTEQVSTGRLHQWFQAVKSTNPDAKPPGMTLLDPGDWPAIYQQAVAEGLDVVFVAELSTRGRENSAQSYITFRVMDMATGREGKKIWESSEISLTRLTASARSGKSIDASVNRFVDVALRQVAQTLTISAEFPELTAARVKSRSSVLSNLKRENPLPALMELQFYAWKNLITAEEQTEYYQRILGEADGTRLITGDAAQCREVTRRWMPGM